MADYTEKEFNGFKWLLSLPSNIDTEIEKGNLWEPCVTKWIEDNLKDGDVAIDIGANIGWFTLIMSRAVGSGKVIAFEPEPSFHERLMRHIEINGCANVFASKFALSDQNVGLWCVKNVGPYFSSAATSKYILPGSPGQSVPSVRLDDHLCAEAIGRCDLIKIDVDGHEMEVLRGAEQTIKRYKPKIAIEVQNAEPAALLQLWGYKFYWERGNKEMSIKDITDTILGGQHTINIFCGA